MHIPRHPWIMPESPNMLSLMSDIMNAKVPEILVSGPRNCGKSWIIGQCELSLAEMYPGIQILNLRSEMNAMGGLLSQWDQDILRYGLDDSRNPFTFHNSTKKEPRTHIQCDNGSKILFAGMDKPNKALGTAVDFAYYNEVQLEHNETHWSAILGAMEGGRAGNWGDGKHLAIADMNPTTEYFWAYLRAHPEDENAVPEMKHYYVRHIDHPQFYVWALQQWTNKGIRTTDGLDRAYKIGTFDHRRNVLGEFCAAEGLVYTEYTPEKHRRKVSWEEVRYADEWHWAVDFGGDAPMAAGLIAKRSGLPYIIFKEIYSSKCDGRPMIVQDLIRQMREIEATYGISEHDITKCVTDHYTENHEQLSRAGYPVILAKKDIVSGIQVAKKLLRNDEIILNEDSLWEVDHTLDSAVNCMHREFLGYAYRAPHERKHDISDEKPKKGRDHAMDWFRYWAKEEMQQPLYYLN